MGKHGVRYSTPYSGAELRRPARHAQLVAAVAQIAHARFGVISQPGANPVVLHLLPMPPQRPAKVLAVQRHMHMAVSEHDISLLPKEANAARLPQSFAKGGRKPFISSHCKKPSAARIWPHSVSPVKLTRADTSAARPAPRARRRAGRRRARHRSGWSSAGRIRSSGAS